MWRFYVPSSSLERAFWVGLQTALAAVAMLAPAGGAVATDASPNWAQVAPVFRERCVMCHSREAAADALRLDSYDGAIAGSENGPVLVPGDPSASEMIRRLRGESQPRMPFLSRPLPPEEIALIERWIAAGIPEHDPVAGAH